MVRRAGTEVALVLALLAAVGWAQAPQDTLEAHCAAARVAAKVFDNLYFVGTKVTASCSRSSGWKA
jgi:hypothetical protein